MSNYLAVATVTATIAHLLRPVATVVHGATLTFQRPDLLEKNLAPGAVGINVYMYRATTDPYFENADLPTRWNDGAEAQLPQSALDLDYLISCYGDDTRFEPQRLFGWLEMALHAQPVLTPALIRDAISAYPRLLGGSDLASQIERIKITPHPLSMDDFSKMWSVFLHIPYLLSATYRTSVVLITPERLPPPPALPVLERRIHLLPFDEPVIASIQPQTAPPGSEIVITGRNFTLDGVLVDFPTQSVHVRPDSPDEIALPLPDDLPAGITSVTVTTEYNLGTKAHPEPRSAYTSNVAAFVLQPLLRDVHYEPIIPPQIVATTDPPVHPAQSATLWLYESVTPPGGTPRIYGLQPLHRQATTDSLRFDATPVAPGAYIARLRVDGAESPPAPYDRVVVP